jgi:hypothetical protein
VNIPVRLAGTKVKPKKTAAKKTTAKPPPKPKPAAAKPKTQEQLDREAAARIAALSIDPAKADINAAIKQAEADRLARARAAEGTSTIFIGARSSWLGTANADSSSVRRWSLRVRAR